MKTIFMANALLALCMASISCDQGDRHDGTVFEIPSTTIGNDGWEVYGEPIEIDADSAKNLTPGGSSPEAAVVHFFASKVRGDRASEDVLPEPSQRSGRLQSGLEEYEQWSFKSVELRKRKSAKQNRVVINIFMSISVGGDPDSGEDEVTVERIDGKWFVTGVPT